MYFAKLCVPCVFLVLTVSHFNFDLGSSHVLGVALSMEKDIAPDPMNIGTLGACGSADPTGIVLEPDGVAHPIEPFLWRGRQGILPRATSKSLDAK